MMIIMNNKKIYRNQQNVHRNQQYVGMAVANKVHKQGLQHHALSHITMHPYIIISMRGRYATARGFLTHVDPILLIDDELIMKTE